MFTIPVDVAGFEAGKVLADASKVAEYWRVAYAETNEGANLEHLDDDTIVSLSGDVEQGDDADEYMLSVFSVLEAGGDDDDAPIAEDIRAVAMKVGQSATVTAWIDRVIAGQKDVDSGPAFIAKDLLANLDPQERAILPWPGSETGNNPDITRGTRIVGGESKKFTHSKVKDFISLQPRVSALLDKIKSVASVAEGQKQTQEQKTAAKNLNTSVSAATRAYTLALKAALMMDHLEDHPHITLEWREEDGDISKWKYCLDLGNRHKPKVYGAFTIVGVTKLAPSLIPSTMTYDSMVEALKRKAKPVVAATKYPKAESVADMDDIMSTSVHALESASIWSQTMVAMSIRKNADGQNADAAEQADDIIVNAVRLAELYSDLAKPYMKRYNQIKAEKARAGQSAPPADSEAA